VGTFVYDEFLRIREDILLRIMDAVGAAGTGFAFPSQTVYFGRDTGLDPSKSQAAEDAIKILRERGELPLPDPAPEKLAAMENVLDWPPSGSAGVR
jgi:MscS family membrane protein